MDKIDILRVGKGGKDMAHHRRNHIWQRHVAESDKSHHDVVIVAASQILE